MDKVCIVNATQNNLQGISVSLPVNAISVFTGVSGSGKSSLVFGVLAAESQRQLNFTYPTYLRNRLPHGSTPRADYISGLSTAVIIDQKPLGINSRSTLGTASDAYSLLRLIFSRVGVPSAGYSNAYSFNEPAGMCPNCQGLGFVTDIDESELIDMNKSINQGAFNFKGYAPGTWYWKWYKRSGLFDADMILINYPKPLLDTLLYAPPQKLKNPPANWYATAKYEGVVHRFRRMYLKEGNESHKKKYPDDFERIIHSIQCPECKGSRLNVKALNSLIEGKNINDLCQLSITDMLPIVLRWDMPAVAPAVENLKNILKTLCTLGLGYLQLSRSTTTLSGGEAQRLKMVRHLNSSLIRFIYILDEPSTGLHPRDVRNLADIFKKLRDKGNTVLIVEHDSDLIDCADFIVEMGPGPGTHGGKIIYSGPSAGLMAVNCATTTYLKYPRKFSKIHNFDNGFIYISEACLNNLKNININIPKQSFTVITGVAGSGKSSLVYEILKTHPSSKLIDQRPLRGSCSSTIATYTGLHHFLRKLYSKKNGVSQSWFTVSGKGACHECKGKGQITTELAFLESTSAICEACEGTGYNSTALSYLFKGKNIAETLAMPVSDALQFIGNHNSEINTILQRLEMVGLGYISTGRASNTLSGGERQRVKLATLLNENNDILILDEPTTGLHGLDVIHLLDLFHKLVDRGTTVIAVEHNLDSMLSADWIVDLGPGAGDNGGQLMYSGPSEGIINMDVSLTGQELKRYLNKNQ
ncbi:TPA: ATP-binding cassette domain-containing protein [Raoultella ornithinolytica]|nr:ATP-binding cassette domain-containing protein [Raoultella ornithinolytica]HAT1671162.1 ATP-binding cassette domain-containing protein [Raoultella ornithinolytica]